MKFKNLRSDYGIKYTAANFKRYLKKLGVHHQLTMTYSPQQSGVAERNSRNGKMLDVSK